MESVSPHPTGPKFASSNACFSSIISLFLVTFYPTTMKVFCPVQDCKWEASFSADGMNHKEIYERAKAEISRHKRQSKSCNRSYCACSKSFTTTKGLERHLSTAARNDAVHHYELTYCSVVSNNNHKILNVDTLSDNDSNIVNFSAFRDASRVVFGSTIGADAYDPPPHAIPEFLRAGANVVQNQSGNIPQKKKKKLTHPQFGSEFTLSEDDPFFPMNNDHVEYGMGEEDSNDLSEPLNQKKLSGDLNQINTIADLLSLTSSSRSTERINIPVDTASRIGTTSDISATVNLEETIIDPQSTCRRSRRLARISATTTHESDNHPNSGERDLSSENESNDGHEVTEPELTQDFFVTHAERDLDNEPELNTGFLHEPEEEINIGWGHDPTVDEDNAADEDINLNIEPAMIDNNVTIDELKDALGNLTLDEEINGRSDQLPPYCNGDLPLRTPEEAIGINSNIRRYVSMIKNHRRTVNITCSEHLNYIEVLVEMNRSNAPQSLFDTVAKIIHKNFDKESEASPPTRESILSWVEKKVHPEELIHLSLPRTTALTDCPSGRKVSITHFDYEYQLALLLSNEEIMNPSNLLFPNRDDPFELPPPRWSTRRYKFRVLSPKNDSSKMYQKKRSSFSVRRFL